MTRPRLMLLALLALFACKETTTELGPTAAMPQYESQLVGERYGSTSFGGFYIELEFVEDGGGLMAVLTRIDGLYVEFDVEAEFFPFNATLPMYLVLLPRNPWTFTPYVQSTANSYPTLLLDCYLYTQNGNQWPPSGFDNFGQVNPVAPLFFFRVF